MGKEAHVRIRLKMAATNQSRSSISGDQWCHYNSLKVSASPGRARHRSRLLYILLSIYDTHVVLYYSSLNVSVIDIRRKSPRENAQFWVMGLLDMNDK